MSTQLAPPRAPVSLAPLPTLLLGVAGGALLGARRDLSTRGRAAAAIGGLALLGAAARRPLAEYLRRAGTRRRSANVAASVVVPHPVEVVFGFLSDFENYPRFIGALREVRDYGDGRSHWCASTPSGGTLEWDTVTTKYVPNGVLGWRSVSGAPVRMNALLRFLPEGTSTCLELAISYQVLEGGVADAIAALASPSRSGNLERDFRQLAAYLDTVVSHRAASVVER